MPTCPHCGAEVSSGASKCTQCGHDLSAPVPEESSSKRHAKGSPMLGQPLFPTYKEPPPSLPYIFALGGLVMMVIGVLELFSSEPGACTGTGSLACELANQFARLIYGAENPKLAEASLFFAGGLFFWVCAWHVYDMWRPVRRPGPRPPG